MTGAAANTHLARAAAWRLLALLFERPTPVREEELETLAREVGDADLRAAAEEARGGSEGAYLAVLGPGGPVSAREVGYRAFDDPGKILADVSAFYEAFAYRPRGEDPPDHVAIEAGFVGYLWLKEAFALEQRAAEAAGTTAAARGRFLADHLAPFAEALAGSVGATAGTDPGANATAGPALARAAALLARKARSEAGAGERTSSTFRV